MKLLIQTLYTPTQELSTILTFTLWVKDFSFRQNITKIKNLFSLTTLKKQKP
jgi:hypothetical protein